jgi:HSP20 family molecular chaperone IbpA
MKKILGMLAMALCLIGCSKGPDKVAVAFYEAMADGDFDKAAEYASKDTKPMIEMMAKMPGAKEESIEENKGVKFKAVDTKIDNDKATVKIERKKDGESATEDVLLVKEDGDWKVSINKGGSSNNNASEEDASPEMVAVMFYKALADGNFDKLTELVSEESKPSIKMIAEFRENIKKDLEGATYKALDVKFEEGKAVVKVEIKSKDNKTATKDIDLVHEDGEWKVEFKK